MNDPDRPLRDPDDGGQEAPAPEAAGAPSTRAEEAASGAWSATPPLDLSASSQGLYTLVVTDLVDSTGIVARLGDRRALELGAQHDQQTRRLMAEHGGHEIDKSDGFLLLFERASGAVAFALDYHAALAGFSAAEGVEVRTRIGIHLGEVYLRANSPEEVRQGAKPLEVEGLAKIAAARLMSLAGGGQTLMTRGGFEIAQRAAGDDFADPAGLSWVSHGLYRLQGIDDPVEVCEVGRTGSAPLAPPLDTAKARRVVDSGAALLGWLRQRQTRLALGLLLVLGLVAVLLVTSGRLAVRGFDFRAPAPPEPSRSIAVLATELQPGTKGDDAEVLAYAIRNALVRGLTAFEGLSPEALSEVDAVDGPPTTVALAVGADELLESTLGCRDRDCSLELRRVRGSDGGVEGSTRLAAPRDDLLTAARAAGAGLRQVYPEKSLRPGHAELEVTPEDYAAYVEIRRAFDARPESSVLLGLLDRLETLRQRSPRFVEAFLCEAEVAWFAYTFTREDALLARALDRIAEAQSMAPEDPQVLFMRSYIELNAGRLEDAAATLATLERLVPGDVQILDRRARLQERRGAGAEALELAGRALERSPSWQRLVLHASMAYRQGEMSLARGSLERLLEQRPDHVHGTSLLAKVELVSGDPHRAVDLYTGLVARASTPSRLSNLGLAHMLVGDFTASEAAFDRAHAEAPSNPLYLLNLADARCLAGRAEEAADLYRQIEELISEDTTDPQLLTVLGQALAHLDDRRAAVAAVQRAARIAPEKSSIAFESALVYALVGDFTAAEVSAERAVELGYDPRWLGLPWFDELRTRRDFARIVAPGP